MMTTMGSRGRYAATFCLLSVACASKDDAPMAGDAGLPAQGDAGPGVPDAPIDARSADAAADAAMEGGPLPDLGVAGDVTAACTACTAYAPARELGRVMDPQLNAVSGIAASRRNPGVLYLHNDRDRAEFFAVSESGAVVGRFGFTGAAVRDLEDIAVASCPAGTCVLLADIGGNLAPRPDYQILRVPEPAITGGAIATGSFPAERLVFTYADGPHNAESLLVDPGSGTLYVITKVAAGVHSAVYRLPAFGAGGPAVAAKIADLPVPAAGDQPATAADAHPCGTGFLLRTNNTAYEFRIPAGTPFEESFRVAPAVVPAASEAQSEGIAYRPDGRGYYTTSEGSRPPVDAVECK